MRTNIKSIAYTTGLTGTKYKSGSQSTKDSPKLALTGKLWGVFGDDFSENWLHYNGTALYIFIKCPTPLISH